MRLDHIILTGIVLSLQKQGALLPSVQQLLRCTLVTRCTFQKICLFAELFILKIHPGDHGEGETPVPIPNTAVKPLIADGTAAIGCGRVGRCRVFVFIYFCKPHAARHGAFFLLLEVEKRGKPTGKE